MYITFLVLFKFIFASGTQNDCSKNQFILGETDDELIDLARGSSSSGQCGPEPMFDPAKVEKKIVEEVRAPSPCPPGDLVSQDQSYLNIQVKAAQDRQQNLQSGGASTSSCSGSASSNQPACSNFNRSWLNFIQAYMSGILDKGVFEQAQEWIKLIPNQRDPKKSKILCVPCSTHAAKLNLMPRKPGQIVLSGIELKPTKKQNKRLIEDHAEGALHNAVKAELLKKDRTDLHTRKIRFKEKRQNEKTNYVTRTVMTMNQRGISFSSLPTLMLMQGKSNLHTDLQSLI